MTNPTTIEDVLHVLYMQGEDAGRLTTGSATHQIAAVQGAITAIEQLVLEKVIGINGLIPEDLDEAITDAIALALTKNVAVQSQALKQILGKGE